MTRCRVTFFFLHIRLRMHDVFPSSLFLLLGFPGGRQDRRVSSIFFSLSSFFLPLLPPLIKSRLRRIRRWEGRVIRRWSLPQVSLSLGGKKFLALLRKVIACLRNEFRKRENPNDSSLESRVGGIIQPSQESRNHTRNSIERRTLCFLFGLELCVTSRIKEGFELRKTTVPSTKDLYPLVSYLLILLRILL